MTVMPFILIFQLVFSGGVFSLPKSVEFMSDFTFSHYGLQCITAQSGYNELPMISAWQTLDKMKDSEIETQTTVGQTMDVLQTNDNEALREMRETKTESGLTAGDILKMITKSPDYKNYSDKKIKIKFKVSDVIDLFGREKVKQAVNEKSMEAGQNSAYEKTVGNIANCWLTLGLMALVLALLSIIALEFIDKDKR